MVTVALSHPNKSFHFSLSSIICIFSKNIHMVLKEDLNMNPCQNKVPRDPFDKVNEQRLCSSALF